MKKWIVWLLVWAMGIGLTACNDSSEPTTETTWETETVQTQEPEKIIAVIGRGDDPAFWQIVKSGAEEAGEKAGYTVEFWSADVENQENARQQQKIMQQTLSDKNVKGVVLATMSTGFREELADAFNKGIPVVAFASGLSQNGADITPGKDPTVCSVATDNQAAATKAAENFYAWLKENALVKRGYKIGVIQHDTTAEAELRAQSFVQKITELAKQSGIKLETEVQVAANRAGEYRNGLLKLQKWGAEAIFMTDQSVVEEVFSEISAMAEDYKEILFCGFGAGAGQYTWMKDAGQSYAKLVGSVTQDPYAIGYQAVECMLAQLAGIEASDLGIAGVWYTAETIDQLKEENVFYMN